MALSACDANKWRTLLAKDTWPAKDADRAPLGGSDAPQVTKLRQRQRRLAEADVARLKAKYAEGATTYELAAEFGCSRPVVVAKLRRAGVEPEGKRRLRLDDLLLTQVIELRTLGLSIREIARRTSVSRTKVDRYLRYATQP